MRLTLTASEEFFSESVGIEIDNVFRKEWEPLRTTDIFELGAFPRITGEVMADSEEAQIVVKMRKDAAREIANALTEMIIDLMSTRDTFNGYKKGE